MTRQLWVRWQQQVLSKIRHDYDEVLNDITIEDVDWSAWRHLYDQGRSAGEAVDYAFVRETQTLQTISAEPAIMHDTQYDEPHHWLERNNTVNMSEAIDSHAPAIKINGRNDH